MREFDELYGKNTQAWFNGKLTYSHRHERMKSFIASRLTLQRKEVREMVQKKLETWGGQNGKEALSDVLNTLDN